MRVPDIPSAVVLGFANNENKVQDIEYILDTLNVPYSLRGNDTISVVETPEFIFRNEELYHFYMENATNDIYYISRSELIGAYSNEPALYGRNLMTKQRRAWSFGDYLEFITHKAVRVYPKDPDPTKL